MASQRKPEESDQFPKTRSAELAIVIIPQRNEGCNQGGEVMTPSLDCRRAFLRRLGFGLTATAFGALFFRGSVARAQSDSDCAVVDLQRKYGDDLMKLKGVIGHGIGLKDGKEALMIFVKDEAAAKYIENLVRDTIEGHPVVIFVSGELTIR